MEIHQKLKIHLPYNTDIPLLCIHTKEVKLPEQIYTWAPKGPPLWHYSQSLICGINLGDH
jgi:hypothetical protein